jgi:hypothetical protein
LQGLRGVLAASPVIGAAPDYQGLSRPAPSEASLARAELLQSLLGQPIAGPQPRLRRKRGTLDELVERWLVAAVLLSAVLAVLLLPLTVRPVPRLTQPIASPGALQLYQVVEDLGAVDHVLVAFDYGVPEADELNAVARPVLRHVIDRGADISIVSTRPDGPMVASALLSEMIDAPDQYRLFGYRPGAVAAASHLLAGADPQPTVLLILTSRPASLRGWVEQARARYGDQLPVVLASSAALEPVVSPFLDAAAGQLKGSIHGLSGAASYETLRGGGGDAVRSLDALAAGHLAIVLLMIVGAVFYLLTKDRGEDR